MKPIQEALKELERAITSIDLITHLYTSTFTFLFSAFLLLLVKIPWTYASLPTLIYFFVYGYKKTQENKYLKTEQHTPELQEKLRTAADNLDKENEIVTLLQQEVIKDMRKVETSKFIDFKDLTIKAVLLLTLAFLTITISYLNVGLDLPNFAKKAQAPLTEIKERIAGQDIPTTDTHISEGNLSTILGNKSLALLGKKEIILQLNPLQSEVNLEEIKDAEKKDFSPQAYPKEIYTSYDIASNERLPKQNSKVIKSYFQQISR